MNDNGMDASGNYNVATLYGDVTGITNRSGANNFALTFDGINDYLEASDSNSLDVATGDFSISVWVKIATTTNSIVIDKRASSGYTGYVVYFNNMTPTIRLGFESSKTNFYSTSTLTTNAWFHIVITVDRDSLTGLKFYVNNVLSGESNPTGFEGDDLSTDTPCQIATSKDYLYDFSGEMDDLRIYKRVLTTAEINALYNEINPDPITYTAMIGIPDQGSNSYGDIATLSKNINGIFVQINDSYDDTVTPIVINNFFSGNLNWMPKSISIVDLDGDTGLAVMAEDEDNDEAKVHIYNLDTSSFVNDMITLPLYGN